MIREVVRLIQDARKEARYAFSDQVKCFWQSNSEEIKKILFDKPISDTIKKQAILSELTEGAIDGSNIEKEAKIGENDIKIYLLK
jgi:hypothetical protein